jgi:hypothetical protein
MAQSRFSPSTQPLEVVHNLVDALRLFDEKMDARKTEDVILKNARVGSVFVENGENKKYLVLYKREKYLHFSKHFPQVPEKGYAIIANVKLVHWAAMQNMDIVTIFPDGTCYSVKATEFWNFYEKWNTEHPAIPEEIALPFRRWEKLF